MPRISHLAIVFLLLSISPILAASPQPVTMPNGMVVTSQRIASEVGADILRQGGNAIDAAVAVGYALAVVNPCCGNIGGGGFATLHLADGRDVFVNFREKAPKAATETMFLDAKGEVVKGLSLKGHLAVAVPGTVMGLDTLLARYGTMARSAVMAPAIKLAEEGFMLSQGDADILARGAKDFAEQANVAAIFLRDGKPLGAGELLVQKDLAATLRAIAETGPDAFYRGNIAAKVAAASVANGGVLTKADFESYTVTEDAPVRCDYRGFVVISSPPPSSGGTAICMILNILEGYDIRQAGWNSSAAVHLMTEAMRHAFVDRNFQLGDPDFVTNPLAKLLDESYAALIRQRSIRRRRHRRKTCSRAWPRTKAPRPRIIRSSTRREMPCR